MPHAIKAILAFFITATVAPFLAARDKIQPGQAGVKVEAEKIAVDKTPTAEQRRALEVLHRIFDSANRIKSDDQGWTYELKMKLQAQIADAVWDYDQARARRLFEQAFHPIKQGVPENERGPLQARGGDRNGLGRV